MHTITINKFKFYGMILHRTIFLFHRMHQNSSRARICKPFKEPIDHRPIDHRLAESLLGLLKSLQIRIRTLRGMKYEGRRNEPWFESRPASLLSAQEIPGVEKVRSRFFPVQQQACQPVTRDEYYISSVKRKKN